MPALKQTACSAWLRRYLETCGPSTAAELYGDASEAGFTPAQVKRAKKAAGAESYRTGWDGPWYWRLVGQAETRSTRPALAAPKCVGCSRAKPLTDGYCSTCSQVRARTPVRRPESRPKTWGALW